MSDTATKDKIRDLERRVTAQEIQTSRTPVRLGKVVAPKSGNVIYAQVLADVDSSDPTFAFAYAIAEVGTIPTGGTGTGQNQYAQEYTAGDWVHLFEELGTPGLWRTERGGTSGSQVVYFELTEDKSYSDAAKLAKPVLPDGTLDSGADAFHVVDDKLQFYGKAATGGADGYRGFALRYTDDYSEGVPGFRIITMEGPAHWFIATLTEAWSMSATACSVGGDEIWGRPFRGVRLPATGDVDVYDDLSVATGGEIGDKWLVAWDEADEHYIFVVPLTPPAVGLTIGMVTATIAAATMDGSAITCTPGIATSAVTKLQWDDADLIADGSAIHGVNFSKTALRASTGEPLIVVGAIKTDIPDIDEAFIVYSVYDLRMLPGLSSSVHQVPYHDASAVDFKLDGEDCP